MIKINRINDVVDHNTVYKVFIDSLAVTEIYNGELKDINLKSGKHYIEIKSDEFKSNKIKFDLADGEIIEFVVKPDYDNNGFSKFITKFLFGKVGIKIQIKSDIFL